MRPETVNTKQHSATSLWQVALFCGGIVALCRFSEKRFSEACSPNEACPVAIAGGGKQRMKTRSNALPGISTDTFKHALVFNKATACYDRCRIKNMNQRGKAIRNIADPGVNKRSDIRSVKHCGDLPPAVKLRIHGTNAFL